MEEKIDFGGGIRRKCTEFPLHCKALPKMWTKTRLQIVEKILRETYTQDENLGSDDKSVYCNFRESRDFQESTLGHLERFSWENAVSKCFISFAFSQYLQLFIY